MSQVSVATQREIRLSDVLIFLAVSNVHYLIFEILGLDIAGYLPISVALIMSASLLTGNVSTIFAALPYVVSGALYFTALTFIEVGYSGISAYVTMMQTATLIAFFQYLLSLGPSGARDVVNNVQKILAVYIVGFTFLAVGIRISGNTRLMNQVAGSNYVGLLTTYLILNVLRRQWTTRREAGLMGISLLTNVIGAHRASFLINGFLVARKYFLSTRVVVALLIISISIIVLVYGNRIESALVLLSAPIGDYYSLAVLRFADLETVIKNSAQRPGGTYDASLLVRAFSVLYIGGQIVASPMTPIAGSEYQYLSNSHNLVLEYFKVGGLLFVAASFVALFRRCRALIRRGYCRLSGVGAVLALGYAMLTNDLFIGFFLLPLAFDTDWTSGSGSPIAVRRSAARRGRLPSRVALPS